MTQPRLFTGAGMNPFVVEPADFERWSKQRKNLFHLLKDGRPHFRENL